MKKTALIILVFCTVTVQAITPVGLKLIKQFEGLALTAYYCPANVLTIGYGDTKHARKGLRITERQADIWLMETVEPFERSVIKKSRRQLRWHEQDALTAFTYNLGAGVLKGELLSDVVSDRPKAVTARMKLYCKARVKGKMVILRGLERRRTAEAKLYEGNYE